MEKQKIKLIEICDIQYGFAFESKQFTENASYIPLIRIRDVKRGYSDTYYKGKYNDSYVINNGDILIGMDGEFNIAKWRSRPALLNQRVCKIVGNENIIEDYLFYYLRGVLKEIESKTSFATVKHLSAKALNAIELSIHKIDEQAKIANILNTTKETIENRKIQLVELDDLFKSRFVEMFGDPVTNPMAWSKLKCKIIMRKIGSGATPKGGNQAYKDEGISLIRSMNIHNDRFEYKDLAFIDDDQAEKLKNVTIEENDVLLNITGASVARCCIVPNGIIPARVNQHVSILRCKDIVDSIFLSRQLTNVNFQTFLWNIATSNGATREAITKQQLEQLEVIVPPIKLQKQFSAFVQQVEKAKLEVQRSLHETQKLFDSLMQEYFE